MLLVGVGLGLGMTPATNAIVESLPRSKQGLASAVNDTSRELGAAFGIAIIGSAFSAGYRSHIAGGLAGLPAQVAEAARQAPAAALQAAGSLGPNGQALAHHARSAFVSGQRIALLIGAVALAVGVAFLLLGGGPAPEDALDEATDAVDWPRGGQPGARHGRRLAPSH